MDDPTGVLFFLIVSSLSCSLVSLVLFYKTVRLSNARLTRLAELVSPLLGQLNNYNAVVFKFLYLWSGFLKALYIYNLLLTKKNMFINPIGWEERLI